MARIFASSRHWCIHNDWRFYLKLYKFFKGINSISVETNDLFKDLLTAWLLISCACEAPCKKLWISFKFTTNKTKRINSLLTIIHFGLFRCSFWITKPKQTNNWRNDMHASTCQTFFSVDSRVWYWQMWKLCFHSRAKFEKMNIKKIQNKYSNKLISHIFLGDLCSALRRAQILRSITIK